MCLINTYNQMHWLRTLDIFILNFLLKSDKTKNSAISMQVLNNFTRKKYQTLRKQAQVAHSNTMFEINYSIVGHEFVCKFRLKLLFRIAKRVVSKIRFNQNFMKKIFQ